MTNSLSPRRNHRTALLHRISTLTLLLATLLISSCKSTTDGADASGAFETDETIVSSEASGTLLSFDVTEGATLRAGDTIGFIDSTQLYLRKQQLEAQVGVTTSQKPDIGVQVASLQAQLADAETNLKRAQNLVKAGAATQSQLDDATTHVEVLHKQIAALHSQLSISTATLSKSVTPIKRQIAQLDDQLSKCRIINPIVGTVLAKYSQAFEVVGPGKPLYKIANIDTLTLRAYISNAQLSLVKLGQSVHVRVDSGTSGMKTYAGLVSWVSDKAEFTPKTIQTKEERTELVWAIKVRVPNDGYLKIGMYGEVLFK